MEIPQEPAFKIVGGDGREYGPITLATLLQWAGEGRVAAQTQVWDSRLGTWRPAGQIAELAGIFPPAAPAYAPAPGFTPGSGPTFMPAPGPALPLGPPPGIELAEQVLQRDYTVEFGPWINEGWEFYKANFGFVLVICLIFYGIAMGVSLVGAIPCIGPVVQLGFNFIIQPVLMGGLWYAILRRRRGQQVEVTALFDGFSQFFGQAVLVNLIMTLIIIAAGIPGGFCIGIGMFIAASGRTPAVGVPFFIFGGLLLLVAMFFLTVCYQFAMPLVADRRMEFWPALETSRRVVSRHWWAMFALVLLIGLIVVAGFLACCVGVIFTAPLAICIAATAYDHIFGPPV